MINNKGIIYRHRLNANTDEYNAIVWSYQCMCLSSAREARRAQQEKRQRARRAAAAAPTRRSTRAAAQRRSEPQSDESCESESGESSPVSRSGQAMRGAGKPSEGERRSTRNTRRRVSSEDSESD